MKRSTRTRNPRGCCEYNRLSRRQFLGLAGGTLTAAAVPGWLPRVVFAEEAKSPRDVMVSIFLRGGWDSLSVCVPYAESNYYQMRPTLAVPEPDPNNPNAAVDLDGFFGFNPAMSPLMEAYQDGDLLVVHACGLKTGTRSHFEATHFMEVGMAEPPPSLATGWLGRHLQTTAPSMDGAILRALGVDVALPRTLVGGPLTLPVPDPAEFGLSGDPATADERRQALEAMYAGAADYLRTAAENTFSTVDLLGQINFAGYQPGGGATYPDNNFGSSLSATAALIKAEVGVEAVAMDLGGWDTHEQQGPLNGLMAFNMDVLAQGLAAFHKDLFSDDFEDVVVTVLSEFGRNARENGSLGTDHGSAAAMLVLGGHIAGGRVLTQWPGLEDGELFEGQDLDVTLDYRDILGEILTRRLGNTDVANVFSDASYTPVDYKITQ